MLSPGAMIQGWCAGCKGLQGLGSRAGSGRKAVAGKGLGFRVKGPQPTEPKHMKHVKNMNTAHHILSTKPSHRKPELCHSG